MLIYNFQKEFLGIDKKDLNILGFNDLASLKAEVADFADLFVKTPGYIHNFKHVHWIDFITCAESNEKPKAIINVNSKSFKCTLDIKTAFLVDNPSAEAYFVHMNNLRALSSEESELISADLANKTIPAPTSLNEPAAVEPETFESLEVDNLNIDEFDNTPITNEVEDDFVTTPNDTLTYDDDYKLDVAFDDFHETPQQDIPPVIQEEKVQPTVTHQEPPAVVEDEEDDYVYDPHVASAELGLPLDLIEEFIQDFILQAKEFKDDLYSSLENGDLENVKILSHKLKGVAANLRVENAFEVLTTINTTSDFSVIKPNLDRLYRIIAKLAGEKPEPASVQAPTPEPTPELKIQESEVPSTLDIDTQEEDQKIALNLDDTEEETAPEDVKLDIDLDMFEDDIQLEFKDEVETVEEKQPEDTFEPELTLEIQEPELSAQTPDEKLTPQINYSKQRVANEIGIDLNTFEELLKDYQKESHTILSNMQTALENNDLEIYQSELTKFKGMSENIRLTELNELIEALENTTDKESITHNIEVIESIISQILEKRD